ncbi:hypothetical protein ALC56_05524 [Trachymyrmex septentrionalis]|uniref:Uncharacterized protein n=1 Tax=Trachymyrmex septentrionalis TaxID=34720 RepID=A0A151JXX0_9HYME|nr:hypothetical protein ALC56_05524 [Trachymyrmex septentrionalis]
MGTNLTKQSRVSSSFQGYVAFEMSPRRSVRHEMEESSRNLLQHKHRAEQLKQEKTALTLSYEVRKTCLILTDC